MHLKRITAVGPLPLPRGSGVSKSYTRGIGGGPKKLCVQKCTVGNFPNSDPAKGAIFSGEIFHERINQLEPSAVMEILSQIYFLANSVQVSTHIAGREGTKQL